MSVTFTISYPFQIGLLVDIFGIIQDNFNICPENKDMVVLLNLHVKLKSVTLMQQLRA